jgi:hypothetical protein
MTLLRIAEVDIQRVVKNFTVAEDAGGHGGAQAPARGTLRLESMNKFSKMTSNRVGRESDPATKKPIIEKKL